MCVRNVFENVLSWIGLIIKEEHQMQTLKIIEFNKIFKEWKGKAFSNLNLVWKLESKMHHIELNQKKGNFLCLGIGEHGCETFGTIQENDIYHCTFDTK